MTAGSITLRDAGGNTTAVIPTNMTGNMGGIGFLGGVAIGGAPVPSSLGWGSGTPASAEEAWQRIADWAYALIGTLGSGPLP
jgi:hypothetical protein